MITRLVGTIRGLTRLTIKIREIPRARGKKLRKPEEESDVLDTRIAKAFHSGALRGERQKKVRESTQKISNFVLSHFNIIQKLAPFLRDSSSVPAAILTSMTSEAKKYTLKILAKHVEVKRCALEMTLMIDGAVKLV